jgi:hypothetical protein
MSTNHDGPGEEDGPWAEGWAERSNHGKGQAVSKPRPGSRMRKYMCKHGQIIRAARDDLEAKCTICESRFTLRDIKP